MGTDGGGLNLFDPVTKNFFSLHTYRGNKKKRTICGNYVLKCFWKGREVGAMCG